MKDYLEQEDCFKPYYKWIIFNILSKDTLLGNISNVLNLIING